MVKTVRNNKEPAPDKGVERVKKLPAVPVELLAAALFLAVFVPSYVVTRAPFWDTYPERLLFWAAVTTSWAFSFKFAARKICQHQATPLLVLEKRLLCYNVALRLPRGKNVPGADTVLFQAKKELGSLLCELEKSGRVKRLVILTWLIDPKWLKHFPIPPHETRLIRPLPALPKRLGAFLTWKKRAGNLSGKMTKRRDPWRSRWYRFVWNFRGPNDKKPNGSRPLKN